MYRLSPSKLNLLEECPRCFWLATVKRIERPSGPMASIVMKMDSILKSYFDRYRGKDQLPPIIKEKVGAKLAKNMPKTLYHKENDEITVMGRPDDYLELDEGNVVAFDHKTRSRAPDKTHPAHQLQLDVYSYLLQANGYKTTNKGYLAYYYPCDCDVHNGLDIHCKVTEIQTSPVRAKALLKKAEAILKGGIPEAGKECEFCRWNK